MSSYSRDFDPATYDQRGKIGHRVLSGTPAEVGRLHGEVLRRDGISLPEPTPSVLRFSRDRAAALREHAPWLPGDRASGDRGRGAVRRRVRASRSAVDEASAKASGHVTRG